MPEVLIPNTPDPLAGYRVQSLLLDWAEQRIKVWVRTPAGAVEGKTYNGTKAVAMMKVLNTANLSVKSLHRRVLETLASDGLIPSGTVSGVPE